MNLTLRNSLYSSSLFLYLFIFLFVVTQIVTVTVTDASSHKHDNVETIKAETVKPAKSQLKAPSKKLSGYHINFDKYLVKTFIVKKGQTLTHILKPHKVPMSLILKIADTSKNIFDVRRIKAGQSYRLLKNNEQGGSLRYLIYDLNNENYVVFDFKEPVRVYRGCKNLEIKKRMTSGTITVNFWHEVKSGRLTEELVRDMADIFNSTLDFRQLQMGDAYKIIYEEKYIQGKCVGTGQIIAAKVIYGGKEYKAFRFINNGVTGYYDENGTSLEKSFLKCPLKYRKITSGFSMRRLHPVTQRYRSHPGIDYAAPMGTPVRAVGDGVVIAKGYNRTCGNHLKIDHRGVGISEYLHFSRFHAGIKKSKKVHKGDIIGYVGKTGLATGPHLDLRFMKNGRYVDYRKLKLPDGKPVPRAFMPLFQHQIAMVHARWENDAVVSLDVDTIKGEVNKKDRISSTF